MRNLKKFLALVLAFVMAMSLMVTVNASSFDDSEEINGKYAEAVDVLTELGVINGYETEDGDTIFQPEKSIKRSEVAALLYRITTGDVDDKNIHLYEGVTTFSDVPVDYWYTPYVNYCADNGLIVGVGGDRFAPNSNITGYQILVMMLRAIGYNNADEFTGADWKLKASGYATKLGITKNLVSGSLGLAAERQVVAEIMFQSIQAPMVTYSPLLGYATDLLVDAAKVNAASIAAGDGLLYANDVPNTLMYQTFKIVGKRYDVANNTVVLGADNYGRPRVEWVKDASTDTVSNGGKYIVNPVAADTVLGSKINNAGSVGTDGTNDLDAGTAYIPASTLAATYSGTETAALELNLAPVKIYKGTVVTECQFSTDVNNNKTIDNDNVTEYLNGGIVKTRDNDLDINHTQEGTIGAAGRTTEVYKVGDDFIIVYIDNFMGVVGNIVPRTFDTAGNHVMTPATMEITFNDNVTITKTSTTEDFEDYKKGDLVQFTTWGMSDQTTTSAASGLVAGTVAANQGALQTTVPAVDKDFTVTDGTEKGAVDIVGKAKTVTVTVKGTLGPKNHKNEIETSDGNYKANIVYLANQTLNANTGVQYYKSTATADQFEAADSTSTVPSDPNYSYAMNNAAINKEYTLVLDENGFVIGMTQAETTTDIGVVMGMEPVRIGTGKWAIEATLMMMDKTEKTVRLLQPQKADGTAQAGTASKPAQWDYWESMSDAEDNIGTDNLKAEAGVLVKIAAFNKNGETYYMVVETQAGEWTDYDGAEAVGDDRLIPGDASTLTGSWDDLGNPTTYTINTDYSKNPGQDENVDDNTKFLIGVLDWDYSLNEGNEGGYADLDYTAYTGFKNIPMITGDTTGAGDADTADVLYQRIDNNVFVFPNTKVAANKNVSLNYTVMSPSTVADPDLYLVYATGTTYQTYSTYKALKNGEPVELKVSNNNLTGINKKLEDAMTAGSETLVRVLGTNVQGYATDVEIGNGVTLAKDDMVCFDKTGVIADNGTTDRDGGDVEAFYTVADDCVVKIVNLETGSYYNATLDSVKQYELYSGSHAFVLDFDEYGYVDTIYIID